MADIRTATPIDVAKLTTLGAVWGSAFICIEIALGAVDPWGLVAARVTVGAAVLLIVAHLLGQAWPRRRADWIRIAVVGLLNSAVPFFLISWGQQAVPANLAAILMASGPFVALGLSHVLTHDDRMTPAKVVGLTVGFAGVVVVVGVDAMDRAVDQVMGQLSIMGASASYAVAGVLTRRLDHLPTMTTSAAILALPALVVWPLALAFAAPVAADIAPVEVLAILFLGLVPTGAAQLLRFQILRDNGAVFMSQVSYLVPVFGVFWAWAILAQRPAPEAWAALALILLGIYISRRK